MTIKWRHFSGLDVGSNPSQHFLKPNVNPEQGTNFLQFYEGWDGRKVQKKSLKLADVYSCGLRKDISIISCAMWSSKCWQNCSKLSRRSRQNNKRRCYTKQQIFSADKADLYWKRMPSKTLIASKEKSVPGLNISQNRVTLFLGLMQLVT